MTQKTEVSKESKIISLRNENSFLSSQLAIANEQIRILKTVIETINNSMQVVAKALEKK